MIYFYAGAYCEQDQKYLFEAGAENCLQSFFYINTHDRMFGYDKKFKRYWYVSGGYTGRIHHKHIDVVAYSEFLKGEAITHAFELDTNDFQQTEKNRLFLLKNNPETKIIPIFHGSDFITPKKRVLLDALVAEGFDLIGLGGLAGVKQPTEEFNDLFFKYTFARTEDKIKVHCLGMSDKKHLVKYPFYSCDSTSWLSIRKYGTSSLDKIGKDLKQIRHRMVDLGERLAMEIQQGSMVQEKFITDLWKQRGIEWQD